MVDHAKMYIVSNFGDDMKNRKAYSKQNFAIKG
jgi:hypothetical protein